MIRKILRNIKNLINLPKTLYINFKCMEFNKAIKLPIQVNHRVKLGKLYKGAIEINCDIHKYMIKLGFSGAGFVSENKSYLSIGRSGKIIFEGSATIAEGLNIFIDKGIIKIGKNFYANRNIELQSENRIEFGDNCLLGWNVSIRDTDGHKLIKDGEKCSEIGEILIGDHVWIASHCIILKDSVITDESVVGCNSLVSGVKMEDKNSLLVGCPARIKRKNISWEE